MLVERVIEFSARNKFLVLVVTAVAVVGGVWCVRHVPLDAIPDLTDTQVIVLSRWDRSPDLLESQVTYPIISGLLGAPRVKAVRGVTDFGWSFVYVVFQDGTDLYWARSRVLEYLSKIQPTLPDGVRTELGPDATGVGWVFQYALVDRSGRHGLDELRSFQDWRLRYWLQSVPGVAEVAAFGGYRRQYQINLDPSRLLELNVPLMKVVDAIRRGNGEVGGGLIEMTGAEYMIRGRGYARSVRDFEEIAVGTDGRGTPLLVKDLGSVALGPEPRRGVADLDGLGDTVGGIVVMRQGENALHVIEGVKRKLEETRRSLPEGVEVVTTYDRSRLIRESIATLTDELILALIIVSLMILIFLWHIPSALVPIITIPISVLLAFIPMYWMGITSNIMSLAGIAISIGVLVDGAIIEVENAYKKLQQWEAGGRVGDFHEVRLRALKEVGPSVFFSLLVIAVAFLPIFALEEQEGRLFKPLAYTKNLTMALAAVLAITLDPAVRMMFTRMHWVSFRPRPLAWLFNQVTVGRYHPEERHPISRVLFRLYEPPCRWVIRHRAITIVIALLLVASTVPAWLALKQEPRPPLWEGDLLYMPTTLPGVSVTEIQKLMQRMDEVLIQVPEVARVHGKAGRAESATDPAPFNMLETTVLLKPRSEWRYRKRFWSGWPEWLHRPLRSLWPDRIDEETLRADLRSRLDFVGTNYSMLMPIQNRIDMNSTGLRTPVGVKVLGDDLAKIDALSVEIEGLLKQVPGVSVVTADRTATGYFLDFTLRRDQLARHGIGVGEANDVIMTALGGEAVTTTIEGLERYTVSVRYARELRDDLDELRRVLVPTMSGAQIPLEELAELRVVSGPAMIRNENGLPAVFVAATLLDGTDLADWVRRAQAFLRERLTLPPGVSLLWSGQYESVLRVRDRLRIIVPITLFLIFLILYVNTRSTAKALIVLLAVPFSAIGAVWLLYALGYHVSIAVWVGLIALLGLDAETGVFMLLFLDLSYWDRVRKGKMRTFEDLTEAIVEGAVKRIRPKLMTVGTSFLGLLPILWSTGTGADMMKRVAAPLAGGLFTSFLLELLVYPAVYAVWKWRFEMKRGTVDVSRLPVPELRGH
jgi:Cu(I)/Ag(I) efflux system membrane protein CusA/SilA